jgi:hypothetical protein
MPIVAASAARERLNVVQLAEGEAVVALDDHMGIKGPAEEIALLGTEIARAAMEFIPPEKLLGMLRAMMIDVTAQMMGGAPDTPEGLG